MGNKLRTCFHKRKRFQEEHLENYLKKNPELVNELGRYANNDKDGKLETLLSFAVRERRLEDVEYLLSKGADPNIKYHSFLCPVRYMYVDKNHDDSGSILWTAVHEVCRVWHRLVKALTFNTIKQSVLHSSTTVTICESNGLRCVCN